MADASWATAINDVENEEQAVGLEETLSKAFNRDSILLVIDSSIKMLTSSSDDEDNPLTCALKCASITMQNKIMSSDKDKIGLMFYNTLKRSNANDFEGIYLLQDLGLPDPRRILELERFSADLSIYEAEIGSSSEQISMANLFWCISMIFSALKQKEGLKRVFLFTNIDDPHAGNLVMRRAAITRAGDLSDLGIELELFPLDPVGGVLFDFNLFYKDIISLQPLQSTFQSYDSNEEGLVEKFMGTSVELSKPGRDKIMELLRRVSKKENQKRPLSRLPFFLDNRVNENSSTSSVFLGVKLYALFIEAKRPSYISLDAETNSELYSKVELVHSATGKVLRDPVEDFSYVYDFGGQQAVFSFDEVMGPNSPLKYFGPPGLTLLGFKPLSRLKVYHNIQHSYFLYPDENAVPGSTRFMHRLIRRCIVKEKFILARLISRHNTPPRLVALLPEDDSDMCATESWTSPAGLHVIILPFADDIRHFASINGPKPASEPDIDRMKELVDKLMLNNYHLGDIENPSLQLFYSVLQSLALEKDLDVEEHDGSAPNVKDQTLPSFRHIQARVGDIIKSFKSNWLTEAGQHPNEVPRDNMKKRSRINIKTSFNDTVQHEKSPTQSSIAEVLVNDPSHLSRFTVSEMCTYLRENTSIKPAKLKADIIQQILNSASLEGNTFKGENTIDPLKKKFFSKKKIKKKLSDDEIN